MLAALARLLPRQLRAARLVSPAARAERGAQQQCGADDQAQSDEHVCGEGGDPGDVRRAAGLGMAAR